MAEPGLLKTASNFTQLEQYCSDLYFYPSLLWGQGVNSLEGYGPSSSHRKTTTRQLLFLFLFTMSYSNLQLTKQRSGNHVTVRHWRLAVNNPQEADRQLWQLSPNTRLHVIFQTDISDSSGCCFWIHFGSNFNDLKNLHCFYSPNKNIVLIRYLFLSGL